MEEKQQVLQQDVHLISCIRPQLVLLVKSRTKLRHLDFMPLLPKNVLFGKKCIKTHSYGSTQDQSAVQKEAGEGTRNGLFLG